MLLKIGLFVVCVFVFILRVSQGLSALRAIQGLQAGQVMKASTDQKVKKVIGATPASSVQKETW